MSQAFKHVLIRDAQHFHDYVGSGTVPVVGGSLEVAKHENTVALRFAVAGGMAIYLLPLQDIVSLYTTALCGECEESVSAVSPPVVEETDDDEDELLEEEG